MLDQPGVYMIKDDKGVILYVGKAINLRSRVRQYFQPSSAQNPKVKALSGKIREFEYIVTDSEMEALLLECNLIKQNKPRYNIKLVDDKSYPFIKITMNERFPRILLTRRVEKDGARYFGPYSSAGSVRTAIDLVKRLFPIKTCKKSLPADIGKERPCLNYHILQCPGPCMGGLGESEYRLVMEDICSFLAGRQEQVVERLREKMEQASEKCEYEKAAGIRNKINALEMIRERQKVAGVGTGDADVIGFARNEYDTAVQVFLVRGGKLTERRHFIFEGTVGDSDGELLGSFIGQYYNASDFIPARLLLQTSADDMDMLSEWLSGKKGSKVSITVPKRGMKLELVRMAAKNAGIELEQHKLRAGRGMYLAKSLAYLARVTGLKNAPARIEAFDVSNIGSVDKAASMIVFKNGIPKKDDYRMFRIKTVAMQDDYAAMQEAVHRRFSRSGKSADCSFGETPDLILVDGGAGHVGAVTEVLDNLGICIPVYGLVKDDRHRTRGIVSVTGDEANPSVDVMRLLSHIQDEAHRFAVNYSRKLHSRSYKVSELDGIKGVGDARKKALLKHFKSIRAIREASVDELAASGREMNSAAAQKVYDHFHPRWRKTKDQGKD